MGLIDSLPNIDKKSKSVFVMHEKLEKYIPFHKHSKGQLSYIEGGIAYITIENKTYVVPARHYFWIPQGMEHTLRVGHHATILRSLYFYASDDDSDPFYSKLGIYPASELLIQMINYTELWDGKHITTKDCNFDFFIVLKKLLPQISTKALPIILPITDNVQMQKIISFLEINMNKKLTLVMVGFRFGMSERSMSRFFQNTLHVSFLQFLKTIRMVKAIELLLKTQKTINEIAYEVGYGTISSFSDAFYEFTQSRPSDLRKKTVI
ncbi:AraC family transcriptional regulator [Flavobacterium dauae]|uniref:AraC family transcriptional regulator n=1 Tax=Flavobacterium dauae TaxID=1563479 RepID=UPI00101C9C16|nr:AraC family transcriptional regulator [Flavobacterium dauae]WLD22843.1 AraC family transcriptional regulator [Flavobacterium dauae]